MEETKWRVKAGGTEGREKEEGWRQRVRNRKREKNEG